MQVTHSHLLTFKYTITYMASRQDENIAAEAQKLK